MKQTLKRLSLTLLTLWAISGCHMNAGEENAIFQYKESYVGDASAVGNVAYQLRAADRLQSFELKTDEQPYGVIFYYDPSNSEFNDKQTVIYNATFLFSVIHNADWISFHFDSQTYNITRDDLLQWHGEDFSAIQTEDELEKLIQKHLDNEDKINELFPVS